MEMGKMLQYVLVLLSDEEVEGSVRRSIPSHGIHVQERMLLGRILTDVLQNIGDSELHIRFCRQAIGAGGVGTETES